MNTKRTSTTKCGFTLMELMVAMAITTIIVTVLVSITSIALDTWNRSRSELRASREAKAMIDTMARDFESLVLRRGNSNEWLTALAVNDSDLDEIGERVKSTNASKLIFFTATTDRYDGEIGTKDKYPVGEPIKGRDGKNKDKGGDVSCVAYQLGYKDILNSSNSSQFKTFVLSRLLVDPDKTFATLLGSPILETAFSPYSSELSRPGSFVCENVFQFTVTFHVQVSLPPVPPATESTILNVPVTMGKTNESFSILGTGIVTKPANLAIAGGRITAVEISTTVISDFGVDQIKRRTFTGTEQAEFLAKNSYHYTKLVQIPSM